MTERRLKYVYRVPQTKRSYYYFRVRGKFYPLLGEPGSAEFIKNYRLYFSLHRAGKLSRQRIPTPRPLRHKNEQDGPGSIGWLIIEYLKSRQYSELAAATRQNYRRELDLIRQAVGDRILVQFATDDVDLYCAKLHRERGASSADLNLRLISILWKFSKGFPAYRRKRRGNPTHDAEKRYRVKHPHEPWPVDVQQKFLKNASPSLRLAFYLLLFTGQRRCDVVKMEWSDFDGEKINVEQKKTGERLLAHVHAALRALLENTPQVHERILTNHRGKPYTPEALSHAAKRTLRAIGASRYKLHGLRKTAAVALAEAGRSEFEIMSVLGHKTSKMAVYYCREANKAKLNERAIKGWEETANPILPF